VIQVWYRVVDYFYDPATRDDAISIMAARVGLPPAEYATFVNGTKILTLEEARKHFQEGDGFTSLYGSSEVSDAFNVDNKVYGEPQDIEAYIDPSLTESL
jgi:NitT/TauT family transport system substrate-binding protein